MGNPYFEQRLGVRGCGRQYGAAERWRWIAALICAASLLAGCDGRPWNDPYPARDARANVLYGSFTERPKHLDPARSYSSDEYNFIAQIYEPPLQYHFLDRPYRLVPLTVEAVPEPQYLDAEGRPLPDSAPADQIAFTDYRLRIRPGMRFQPHPAFATDESGQYRYHRLTPDQIAAAHRLADFPLTGTRELTAADYVYQIKRLAAPWVHSPIAGLMAEHILGFQELAAQLKGLAGAEDREDERPYLDLRDLPLAGVVAEDRYSLRIRIQRQYRQFVFWLAMPFFAPMPWEADRDRKSVV
jgi:ABC-type transport system substrate-binding protein